MNVKRVKRPKRIATVTAAITTAAIVAAGAAPAFAQPTQEALTSGLPATEAKTQMVDPLPFLRPRSKSLKQPLLRMLLVL